MIEAIYKFGRMFNNVSNKNPTTTFISVLVGGLLPAAFLLGYIVLYAPDWLFLTIIVFVIFCFLTFTGEKIYREYKDDYKDD